MILILVFPFFSSFIAFQNSMCKEVRVCVAVIAIPVTYGLEIILIVIGFCFLFQVFFFYSISE